MLESLKKFKIWVLKLLGAVNFHLSNTVRIIPKFKVKMVLLINILHLLINHGLHWRKRMDIIWSFSIAHKKKSHYSGPIVFDIIRKVASSSFQL